MNMLRYFLNAKLFVAVLAIITVAGLGYGLAVNPAMAKLPEDCENNSVVYCGFQDAAGFKADYQTNAKGDLPAIYSHFDFSSNEMDRLLQNGGTWGWTYRDGRVELDDGRVTGTAAWSMGREQQGKPGRVPFTIAGNTYYRSPVNVGFAQSTTRIRTLVMMDQNNKYMEFAVMTSCGNPVGYEKPTFECKMLNKEQKNDTTFEFWATVETKNATVKNVVYDFGDGKTETRTNASERVSHTYATPGTYTATVKVTYIVNGVEQTEEIQAKCKQQITVAKPVYDCLSLTPFLIEGSRTKYTFTVKAKAENGAVLQTADFTFGDGNTKKGVAPTATNEVKVAHEYAKAGTYTVYADLKFNAGNVAHTETKCLTKVTVNEETCKDNPNRPECQPPKDCKTNPEMEVCKELPKTGPAETLIGAMAISGAAGAGIYYRNARRNFIAQILNKR